MPPAPSVSSRFLRCLGFNSSSSMRFVAVYFVLVVRSSSVDSKDGFVLDLSFLLSDIVLSTRKMVSEVHDSVYLNC